MLKALIAAILIGLAIRYCHWPFGTSADGVNAGTNEDHQDKQSTGAANGGGVTADSGDTDPTGAGGVTGAGDVTGDTGAAGTDGVTGASDTTGATGGTTDTVDDGEDTDDGSASFFLDALSGVWSGSSYVVSTIVGWMWYLARPRLTILDTLLKVFGFGKVFNCFGWNFVNDNANKTGMASEESIPRRWVKSENFSCLNNHANAVSKAGNVVIDAVEGTALAIQLGDKRLHELTGGLTVNTLCSEFITKHPTLAFLKNLAPADPATAEALISENEAEAGCPDCKKLGSDEFCGGTVCRLAQVETDRPVPQESQTPVCPKNGTCKDGSCGAADCDWQASEI